MVSKRAKQSQDLEIPLELGGLRRGSMDFGRRETIVVRTDGETLFMCLKRNA